MTNMVSTHACIIIFVLYLLLLTILTKSEINKEYSFQTIIMVS